MNALSQTIDRYANQPDTVRAARTVHDLPHNHLARAGGQETSHVA